MSTDLTPSPALQDALDAFAVVLEGDDEVRTTRLGGFDASRLQSLVDTVEPLYDEINRLLDRLDATPRPVASELEILEGALHALAQAGMEAQFELDERTP